MNDPQRPQRTVSRITVKYVPREDRMRLSMLDGESNPLVLWMTRRLAGRLIPSLVASLDQTLELPDNAPDSAKPTTQYFVQTNAELQMKGASPVVAPPEISEEGLLESVRVRRKDTNYLLDLIWNDGSVTMPAHEMALRQLLRILYRNYQRGGWPIEGVWPDWFAEDAHRSLIGQNQIN